MTDHHQRAEEIIDLVTEIPPDTNVLQVFPLILLGLIHSVLAISDGIRETLT